MKYYVTKKGMSYLKHVAGGMNLENIMLIKRSYKERPHIA
jgi:hypothetical protein